MVWDIGGPGDQSLWSLGSWVKGTVMLGLSLFVMPTFRLAILERLAIMAIGFSDFRILGLRGLHRLGHVWAFVWLPVCLVVAMVICFEGSPVYLEE